MVSVLDVLWFNVGNDGGLVGIVCVEMDDDEAESPTRVIRYFIGTGAGLDAELDKQAIADWGARFPQAAGALLFGREP
jgi:hypothetical protein